jgi:hypothetical protein
MDNFSRLFLAATYAPGFVGFWGSYAPDDDIYAASVNYGDAVTTDDVAALMQWKTGPRFRARAEEFARAVLARRRRT